LSAGKWRRIFLSSGDDGFESVCTKGQKFVTTATVKDSGSSGFVGTWSGCKDTLWNDLKKIPEKNCR